MRRPKEDAEAVRTAAMSLLSAREKMGALGPPSSQRKALKKKSIGISPGVARKLMADVEQFIEDGDFSTATPRHWVALFCWIHEAVYSVSCVDEMRAEWIAAAGAALRTLRAEFDGDADTMLTFLRWVARREEGREAWRRSNSGQGYRLGWRDVWLRRRLLVDWRLDVDRKSVIR